MRNAALALTLLLALGCAGPAKPGDEGGPAPATSAAPASPEAAATPADAASPGGEEAASATDAGPAVGAEAPDFTLPGIQPGGTESEFRLAGAEGPVVVLFYPEAFTPGCTEELCGFRDGFDGFKDAGVTIVAISADPMDSLKSFARSEGLQFFLASDPKGEVASQYGSWAGDECKRTMFVLGPDHKVVHKQMAFNLDNLPTEIADALKAAQAAK